MPRRDDTVNIVKPQRVRLIEASDAPALDNGTRLGPIDVQFETYGRPTSQRDNVILLCHAFSGDAHAAGYHADDDRYPGWWNEMVGPGKAFDTDRFFVVCTNVLGGCQGTTGPGSIDPATGSPYGMSFPFVTIADMVRVQRMLLDRLEVPKLCAVAGGSMGGMQVLEWAVRYPEFVERAIVFASAARLTAQGIAFNAVGRNAIMSDPNWRGGAYYGRPQPTDGLAIARMIGHITYLSAESMGTKFGRRLRERAPAGMELDDRFEVESYLEYQGQKFVDRFDANTYIYLTKAMDRFDLGAGRGGLESALERVKSSVLILAYSSDWLFPTVQSKELVYALARARKDVSFTEIASSYGHDAFFLESSVQTELVAAFLATRKKPV